MKSQFLPKSLNSGTGDRRYTIDRQFGITHTGMHWHDCIEIVYVEKGDMRVFFNSKWNELRSGNMIFVPPGRIHYMHCDNPNTIKTVIGISRNLICDASEKGILLPFETNKINEHCFISGNDEIRGYIDTLNSLDESDTASLLAQAEILKLYAYIYKNWLSRGLCFIKAEKNPITSNVINILEDEFENPPTAEDMATRLNISYSYMCSLLSKNLGTSYIALVNSIRCENAKKLLLTTSKSITDIGLECGFCDTSYFVKIFKRLSGTTPLKFRNENLV